MLGWIGLRWIYCNLILTMTALSTFPGQKMKAGEIVIIKPAKFT